MIVHSGDEPFLCNISDKGFKNTCDFKTNTVDHTGEKPYQCSLCVCDKTFTRSNGLKHYIILHTKENPYQYR